MIVQGFRILSVDGDADKTFTKLVTVIGSKTDNKHGHSDMTVVSSINWSELKVLSVSNELNEFKITRSEFGGSEQNIDGSNE